MKLSFKNRIAFNYLMASALIMAIVFGIIYFLVQQSILNNLDNDLSYEAEKHLEEIEIVKDKIEFKNKKIWEEREHIQIQVNPVFIQLTDNKGVLIDKSPNLKSNTIPFVKEKFNDHFNTELADRLIRQVQLPIIHENQIKGYILTAISFQSANYVIIKLRNILVLFYFFILIGLYFISRFLAGKSIQPVSQVTNTITQITKNNLQERVILPNHKDEIYALSLNFNLLLDRIENALEREKQFSSDVSHELRTPLATLRGTLEVLIRKPRTQIEYEEKIKLCLSEITKITTTLEQLFLLARLEKVNEINNLNQPVSLISVIEESIQYFKKELNDKEINITLDFDKNCNYWVPNYYSNLIVKNILHNAIKYSNNNTVITIKIFIQNNNIICWIEDKGIGIKAEDLNDIYKNFFRSDPKHHKQINGSGLGLSIVKKCVDYIGAEINITSNLNQGTLVELKFKTKS